MPKEKHRRRIVLDLGRGASFWSSLGVPVVAAAYCGVMAWWGSSISYAAWAFHLMLLIGITLVACYPIWYHAVWAGRRLVIEGRFMSYMDKNRERWTLRFDDLVAWTTRSGSQVNGAIQYCFLERGREHPKTVPVPTYLVGPGLRRLASDRRLIEQQMPVGITVEWKPGEQETVAAKRLGRAHQAAVYAAILAVVIAASFALFVWIPPAQELATWERAVICLSWFPMISIWMLSLIAESRAGFQWPSDRS